MSEQSRGTEGMTAERLAEIDREMSVRRYYLDEAHQPPNKSDKRCEDLRAALAAAPQLAEDRGEVIAARDSFIANMTHANVIAQKEHKQQIAAAKEREKRIMIGGNHLASALIGMFGEPPPDYHLEPGAARIECGTQDIYDAWVCWRTIMLIRDERDAAMLADAGDRGQGS